MSKPNAWPAPDEVDHFVAICSRWDRLPAPVLPPPRKGTHESDLPVDCAPYLKALGETNDSYIRAKHWSRSR